MLRGQEFAGHAGDDRQRRRAEFDGADHLGESRDDRFDHRRMESVRGVEPARGDAAFREDCFDFRDRLERTGENGERGRIRGRERDLGVQKLSGLFRAEPRREHRAAGQFLHESRARGDEPQRVLEREDAGERGGDKFADAVSNQRRGFESPRHPELRERIADREDRRLGEARLAQLRFRVVGRREKEVAQIEPQFRAQQLGAFGERIAEDRFGFVQLSRPCARIARPGRERETPPACRGVLRRDGFSRERASAATASACVRATTARGDVEKAGGRFAA